MHLFEVEARKIVALHSLDLKRKSKRLLAANSISTLEPGQVYAFPKLKRPSSIGLSSICVKGDVTILRIAKVTGRDVCKTPEINSNLDIDLNKKF